MEHMSLYVSQYSEASKRTVEICYQLGLDKLINIIGIDNPEIRERIKHGKLFTINVVPTLVSEGVDGNIKLYQGPKAIQFMQALTEERYRALQQRQQTKKSKMLKHLEKNEESDSDTDYDEIEELQDDVKMAIPGGGDSSGVIQKGKVQNLTDIMQQQQARRSEELGYNEKKIPQF